MTLADRIVVMHDGRIEQVGTPMELFLNPANTFVAGLPGLAANEHGQGAHHRRRYRARRRVQRQQLCTADIPPCGIP